MKIDLSNKTALVTGSTVGIRFAIAQRLAERGAAVVLNGRTRALRPGVNVRGVPADAGNAEQCAWLAKAEPIIDILVNNAGIFGPRDFFDTPDSEWTR